MIPGIKITNDIGQTTISDKTYNIVYKGRALLSSSGSPFNAYYINAHNAIGLTSPLLSYYDFYIDAPDSLGIIPHFSCSGYCALSYINRHATIPNRWVMEFFAEVQPIVYCFDKLPVNANAHTGVGVAVFNATNGVSYLSTQPHIIFKTSLLVTTVACDPSTYSGGGYIQQAPSQTISSANTGDISMLTTPILLFSTPNSGASMLIGNTQTFYARVAKISGNSILTRWGTSGLASNYGSPIYNNPPGELMLAAVAEGSQFL